MSVPRRRRFLRGSLALAGLGLLAGCGIVPPQAPAPGGPAGPPRLGLLWRGTPRGTAPWVEAFREGLREHGYIEGQNILIEHRWADVREERLPELAAELVRLPVEVILTGQVGVAMRATGTIPIIGVSLDVDPVGQGQIAGFARPGGNVTGFTANIPGLGGKRLELLKEAVPRLSRVAILSDVQAGQPRIEDVEEAARMLRVRLRVREVQLPAGLEGAFEAMVGEGDEAFMVSAAIAFLDGPNRRRIADLAIQRRLPSIALRREHAEAGGLMAYATSLADLWRRAPSYVDKILKGAIVADLPVQRPAKFDLIINLSTAQALGLVIPPSVLAQATEVIR